LSSILKALKRIEVQSSRSDSFFTMPKTNDTKQANNSKARRRWFIPSLIAVFLVLLVIVMAAIILFSRRNPIITKKFPAGVSTKQDKNSISPLAKSNIFRAKIPRATTNLTESRSKRVQPAVIKAESDPVAGNIKESSDAAQSTTPRKAVGRQNPEMASTARSPQVGTTPARKNSQPIAPSTQKTAVSKNSVAARNVPSGKPVRKSAKPVSAKTYDRIDDSKLKLQALAWFDDASKRMVVINSHIVREGGNVEGYQVTQIRRQDVVVSDGKKSWRLEFALKP
jgi:hypothetical protein